MRHPKKHIDFLTWQSLIKQSTKRDVLSTSEHDVTDTCPTLHVKYRQRVEGLCIQRGGGVINIKKTPISTCTQTTESMIHIIKWKSVSWTFWHVFIDAGFQM